MSFHRFLYMAGWSAVILLAIAGFAAFNAGGSALPTAATVGDVVWGEAAGAVSAQGWLAMAGTKSAPTELAQAPTSAVAVAGPSPNTTGGIGSGEITTGWLDSVALRGLVEDNFATSDINRAVRLAWCLSRFDVDAVDPDTGVLGLFQISPADWMVAAEEMGIGPEADPFNPALNVAVAAHIVYDGGGWGYWSCN